MFSHMLQKNRMKSSIVLGVCLHVILWRDYQLSNQINNALASCVIYHNFFAWKHFYQVSFICD